MKILNYIKTITKGKSFLFVISLTFFSLGCEDYLEVDTPLGQVSQEMIFEDESTANAAVTTLYSRLREDTLLTGNLFGLNVLLGLYTDELEYYSIPGMDLGLFHSHGIMPENQILRAVWNSSYSLIYQCNAILLGLENSSSLSQSVKDQLKAETLFVRSLTYFYLTNLFGNIPFTTQTDYLVNQDLSKTETTEVYNLITEDLLESRSLLGEQYVTSERIRPNRSTVSTLLSRVYLYRSNWEQAEFYASEVINNAVLYNLESLENEFLKESSSAIFQLKPQFAGQNTNEALVFLLEMGPPFMVGLSPQFVSGFEEGDLRKEHWIREVSSAGQSWYMANKYKKRENTGTSEEYSVVFRLSELYLIRAEARLNRGDLVGAVADLNMIRERAGLELVNASDDINAVLIQERRYELFTEHGHRWFDLKRLGKAEEVLSSIKPNWRPAHLLFPIPELELSMNPNLEPQNPGY